MVQSTAIYARCSGCEHRWKTQETTYGPKQCPECGGKPAESEVNPAIDLLRLRAMLQEAEKLSVKLMAYLPVAAPGRDYIEWEQLRWMAEGANLAVLARGECERS
jgi:hypothetical protein